MMFSSHRETLLVQSIGLFCLITSPMWVFLLMYADPDYPPGMTEFLVIPGMAAVALTAVLVASHGDSFLRQVMIVGLISRFVASAVSLYVALQVYDYAADCVGYVSIARYIESVYRATGVWSLAKPLWGIAFVFNAVSGVFILFGASMPMATVLFSLLGYWGQYLAYRAFRIAYPRGDRRMAALLLLLLPSVVYWTSAIGKDSLTLFFIGWAIYGFAQLSQRAHAHAFVAIVFGLMGTLMVRPHVAGMLAISFALPYALGRNAQGAKGIVVKVVGIPLLIGVTIYFATQAQTYLGMDDLSNATQVLSEAATRNNYGSSAFGSASLLSRVLASPLLFFRPFPWEVHNLQAAIASAEAMFLLYVTWRYRSEVRSALRDQWRSGFTLFLLLFLVEFSIVFSAAISNFGLLARERTMAIPMFLMLLCMVPSRRAMVSRTPLLRTMTPASRPPNEPAALAHVPGRR